MTDAATNPRLMTRTEAKRYLRGVDPYQVCPPLSFGRRLLWDKNDIDAALNDMSRRHRSDDNPAPKGANDVEDELARARKRITTGAASGRK